MKVRSRTVSLRAFWRDETGATSIEYALIAVIVAIGLVATLQGLSTNLQGRYESVSDAF